MIGKIDENKPLGRCMNCLLDLLVINLLFIVTSIPVITIGASITALYQVTLAMAEGRCKEPAREYLRGVKENFKQVTPLWLLALCMILALGMDGYLTWLGLLGENKKFLYGIIVAAFILLWSYGDWIWVLTARFDNTRKNMIKNASVFFTRYILLSIIMTIVGMVFTSVTIIWTYLWPVALWLGFSFPIWVKGKIYSYLFRPYVAKYNEQVQGGEA